MPALLRDLHFRAAPDGEHTLAAIHYLAELNGSKKRIWTMHLNISFQALGNAWCTMLTVGYSEQVTRCVCWSDFRMRYAVVTSGWKTAIVGVIRAKNFFRGGMAGAAGSSLPGIGSPH